jgi:hypothetical protein
MNVNFKIIASLIVVIGLVGVGGFLFGQNIGIRISGNSVGLPTSHSGIACIQVTRADGTKEESICNHNQFPMSGRNMTRDYLGAGASLSAINVVAAGNVTTSQAATENWLNGEYAACGLTKAAGTGPTGVSGADANGNWSITKTFTSTCDSVVVNGTALMNGTGAGNYTFAMANFTSATLQTNDQINITWFVWVT